jgi:hypothetical protein
MEGSSFENVHLIAVRCGDSLARRHVEGKGFVTGSDANVYPPMSTQLESLGIPLSSPYAAGNIPGDAELVIVGNAVSRDNPECLEAVRRGLPLLSMPQALAEFFLSGKESIVVAGTHGKTTTTSLLAWSLYDLGGDPSFLVGGIPKNFPVSYRVGKGLHFVIEDEYDTAYFDKGPGSSIISRIVLLTASSSITPISPRPLHLKESFCKLVRLIPGQPPHRLRRLPQAVSVAAEAACPVVHYAGIPGGRAFPETWVVRRLPTGVCPFPPLQGGWRTSSPSVCRGHKSERGRGIRSLHPNACAERRLRRGRARRCRVRRSW